MTRVGLLHLLIIHTWYEHYPEVGASLLDRMCRPLTSDPAYRNLNEPTKQSIAFLRSRLQVQMSCGVAVCTVDTQECMCAVEYIMMWCIFVGDWAEDSWSSNSLVSPSDCPEGVPGLLPVWTWYGAGAEWTPYTSPQKNTSLIQCQTFLSHSVTISSVAVCI